MPPDITGGQIDVHDPVHIEFDGGLPTSSYTVRPFASATTVPIDVDRVVRALVCELDVLLPPEAGATDWFPPELLPPHPAAIIATAAAAAA